MVTVNPVESTPSFCWSGSRQRRQNNEARLMLEHLPGRWPKLKGTKVMKPNSLSRGNHRPVAPQNQSRNGAKARRASNSNSAQCGKSTIDAHAERLLTQLIGPVCAAESIASAKKSGMSLGDWVSEAVSRTDAFGAADHPQALPDSERIALERIADQDMGGEDYAAQLRMESALQRALFFLDVLKKVYADAEQDSRLQDQRVSGLTHLSAGLDAELLICSDLLRERIKQLELQRVALRQLSGRKLSARDLQLFNRDEEFHAARYFARRKAGEGQVAA